MLLFLLLLLLLPCLSVAGTCTCSARGDVLLLLLRLPDARCLHASSLLTSPQNMMSAPWRRYAAARTRQK